MMNINFERLDRLEGINGVGGEESLIAMVEGIPHAFNTASHCDRISECWRRRRIREKANQIKEQAERSTANLEARSSRKTNPSPKSTRAPKRHTSNVVEFF